MQKTRNVKWPFFNWIENWYGQFLSASIAARFLGSLFGSLTILDFQIKFEKFINKLNTLVHKKIEQSHKKIEQIHENIEQH